MGFGSYDESERQEQDVADEGEDAAVSVHENDHDGEMAVESDVSTDELVGRLRTIKESDEE